MMTMYEDDDGDYEDDDDFEDDKGNDDGNDDDDDDDGNDDGDDNDRQGEDLIEIGRRRHWVRRLVVKVLAGPWLFS